MKKHHFIKVFDIGNYQVSVRKDDYGDEDEDGHNFKIEVATQIDIRMQINLGFDNEEKRDKAFNNYSLSQAKKFLSGMKSFVKDNGIKSVPTTTQ